MRIHCPYCGERGLEEFICGGSAGRARPSSADDASPLAWTEYLYLRDNPAGLQQEYWYHSAGCHAWLVVRRDVRTHEIASAAFARETGR
jgi:methylglutamate dehydrogenase subunit B